MKRRSLIAVAVVAGLAIVAGVTIWWKMYRVVPQPAWIAADQRDNYFYGSVGAGETSGIPYWIWLALPRMFPEYLPGPGGYVALGLSWEEGHEMPVGFAKQRVGYIRVTGNCALCHAISTRIPGDDEVPAISPAVPGHSTDIQPLLGFLKSCAQDPRFNADEILATVEQATKLSISDRLLYRFVLVPHTRKILVDPGSVLFDTTIQGHRRNPQSAAPFSEQPMKVLEQQMKAVQMSAAQP
jgi:hypothetical protein